jgi:hypothetical protein
MNFEKYCEGYDILVETDTRIQYDYMSSWHMQQSIRLCYDNELNIYEAYDLIYDILHNYKPPTYFEVIKQRIKDGEF